MPAIGKVYLIGAGPGDAELITAKALRVLATAEVVVYDSLANADLLDHAPAAAGRIYVGKRAGQHSMRQEQINRVLVEEALAGRTVARLKGGDPFVFGRGGEELEALRARGIPFEIIPGVSSAIAVPAYAGIPLTHRALSRSFAVFTGHLQEGEPSENLQIPRADTLVALMGVGNLELLVQKILASGQFTPDTPAGLVQEGTLAAQRSVIGTLGTIVSLRQQHGITAPAVFIVGDVVALAQDFAWRALLPLAGRRVVVLRGQRQSRELTARLLELGAEVIRLPVIAFEPQEDELARLDAAFLAPFTTVIFTSPNGVEFFFGRLRAAGLDVRLLAGKKVYAIGQKTGEALSERGIVPAGIPADFCAEGLLQLLPASLAGESVLIPRAAEARELLPEQIRGRGGQATVLKLYRTVKPAVEGFAVRDGDYVVFTSSSTVRNFFELPQARERAIVPFAFGRITAAELAQHTTAPILVAGQSSIDSLVREIVAYVKNGGGDAAR
jgi:uroporphyrinogen III methyltransferase/synthase